MSSDSPAFSPPDAELSPIETEMLTMSPVNILMNKYYIGGAVIILLFILFFYIFNKYRSKEEKKEEKKESNYKEDMVKLGEEAARQGSGVGKAVVSRAKSAASRGKVHQSTYTQNRADQERQKNRDASWAQESAAGAAAFGGAARAAGGAAASGGQAAWGYMPSRGSIGGAANRAWEVGAGLPNAMDKYTSNFAKWTGVKKIPTTSQP